MKYAFAVWVALSAATAQAQLIVPKGTKATLQVTYQFKSSGKLTTPAKDQRSDWNVLREVSITAQYEADVPQPFGGLHQDDPRQKQDIAAMQGRAAIGKMATTNRFQTWKQTSQTGTYRIDELINRQVFEMTCTETRVCKRTEVRLGAGSLTPPAGSKSTGASLLEVDSAKKDMMVMLPLPLGPLGYTQTVNTTIPEDEGGGTSKQTSSPWMLKAYQPAPAAIPGDFKKVSGSQSYKIDGDQAAGGTLTVNWAFTRQ
jgi:hypothetical protein